MYLERAMDVSKQSRDHLKTRCSYLMNHIIVENFHQNFHQKKRVWGIFQVAFYQYRLKISQNHEKVK